MVSLSWGIDALLQKLQRLSRGQDQIVRTLHRIKASQDEQHVCPIPHIYTKV